MQAIRTRYLGATNTKPARISARCAADFILTSYEDDVSSDKNHAIAHSKLCFKLGWGPLGWVGGDYAGDTYWVKE